jgi:hypothetical protein
MRGRASYNGSVMGDKARVVLWIAGSMALLAFPIRTWIREAAPGALAAPVTPFDRTDVAAARQWLFLRQAADIVPRRSTYTVVAPDSDVEMNLLAMSYGLLPEALPMPSSYYGVPSREIGSGARFLLAYDGAPPASGPGRVRATFVEGLVYERARPK